MPTAPPVIQYHDGGEAVVAHILLQSIFFTSLPASASSSSYKPFSKSSSSKLSSSLLLAGALGMRAMQRSVPFGGGEIGDS